MGNFTTFKNGHASVNDYGIVSEKLYPDVQNFIVFPQTVFSDHSEIVSSRKNLYTLKIDSEGDQGEWYPVGKRKTWDGVSISSLRENLENTPAVELDKIISLIQRKNNHEAADTLIKIIDNAASLSKKEPQKWQNVTSFRHKRRKKKQKSWFDKDIQALKKKNWSNLKHSQPGNLDIQNSHKQSLKLYSDMCKSKRSAFRQEKFDNMDKALFDT